MMLRPKEDQEHQASQTLMAMVHRITVEGQQSSKAEDVLLLLSGIP